MRQINFPVTMTEIIVCTPTTQNIQEVAVKRTFAICQWELSTPTDISIPLTHRLVLCALEAGECLSAFNHFRLCFLNRLSELCNFHLVHQLEQVGFIYLIQKMHGFLALIITVNDDIEVVSVFGNGSNELLSAFRR